MTTRLSISIDAKRAINWRYWYEWLEAAQPTTVGIMDDLTRAKDIKKLLPKALVWHRSFGDSTAMSSMSGKAMAQQHAKENHGDVHAYGVNEPVAGDKMSWRDIASWLTDYMPEAHRLGVRGVIGNVGFASVPNSSVDAGDWDNYLHAQVKYDDHHVAAYHDYAGPLITLGVSYGGRAYEDLLTPEKVQPHTWTKGDEVRIDGPNWHLRSWNRLDLRATKIGITKKRKKILTEYGNDRMQDLEDARLHPTNVYVELTRKYGIPAPYIIMRGMNTYRNVYAGLFPNLGFEEVLFAQIVAGDALYDDDVIGMNWFQVCTGAQDWDKEYGFDFAPLTKLHVLLTDWSKGSIPVTNPDPLPVSLPTKPPACVTGKAAVLQTVDGIRLRFSPNTDSDIIKLVKQGELVKWYPVPEFDGSGYKWVWIENGNLHGYMARVNETWEQQFRDPVIVVPPVDPPPQPEPTPTPDPDNPPPPVTEPGALVSVFLSLDEANQYHAKLLERIELDKRRLALDEQIAALWHAAIVRAAPPQVTSVIVLGAPAEADDEAAVVALAS